MLVAQDFKERALAALRGKWGLAVGTGFVASLLGAYTALGNSSSSSNSDEEDIRYSVEMLQKMLPEEIFTLIVTIFNVLVIVVIVYAIILFVIGGPISLGYAKFNLNLVDGNSPQFSDLFSQFSRLGEGLVMQLLRSLLIFLWALLFVIPGIIATYRYAMAPYILYENPGMSAYEAIQRSKELMEGNKWRLFCLSFSFIGWRILAIFTLGIGLLWVIPYEEAAYAAFYREIVRERYGENVQETFADTYADNGYYVS